MSIVVRAGLELILLNEVDEKPEVSKKVVEIMRPEVQVGLHEGNVGGAPPLEGIQFHLGEFMFLVL